MIVQRNEYVEELKSSMHNGLVKVLTGIRRCGKSYLLSVLFKNYLLDSGVPVDHIVEVPLDRDEFKDYRDAIRLGEFVRSKIRNDGEWTYVFIDEVTLMKDFVSDAALLSDIYAGMGMKVILSGTDSLGFWLSLKDELYDRAFLLHTTFIPFREHSRVFCRFR